MRTRITTQVFWIGVLILTPAALKARTALQDSTDLKIKNSSNVDARGSENSVYIHPTDSRILLVAQNNALTTGISAWVSQDCGKTWAGDNSAAGGVGNGDPAAVIRRSVSGSAIRYVVGQLSNKDAGADLEEGQRVIYKESATSLTWTPQTVADNTEGFTDKNHLWVDNNTSGNFIGRLYSGWSNVGTKRAEAMFSTNGGESWQGRKDVDFNGTKAEWGVNLQVGISSSYLGHVYAAFGEANQTPTSTVARLGFNKSSNGAGNWDTASEIVSFSNRGYSKGEALSGKSIGANSEPSMTVDDSGNIYVVWTQKRADGTSDDAEIYMVKSSNEGSSWTALGSSPKRVNQDSGTTDQWQPWITWDDCTGALAVVFFDSRNDNTKAETFIAVSYDGGSTFSTSNEKKISDVSWSGDASPAGEYIGIAARDGIAYPVWSDDRQTTGEFRAYVSPIYLWGVTQSTVGHSLQWAEQLQLTITANWSTNLTSGGTDTVVLTSPSSVVYTGTATPGSASTSHSVTKTCTCETGDWKYIVKSTRVGFTPRGSDEKTFRINNCVD